jgi:hypothetical protein
MTEFNLDVVEFRALDAQRVLAVGEVRTVSRGGFASTLPLVNIYKLDGGKLRRIRMYHDTMRASERPGSGTSRNSLARNAAALLGPG